MANQLAEYPQGYLYKETFKSFFAVTGEPGTFKYDARCERIPDDWDRQPLSVLSEIPK